MIRDLAGGSQRFCELERSLQGISPRTLSLRLRALEEHGIVERRTYPEVPPRVEYGLTEKGRALVPLIEDMRAYGRRWLVNGDRRRETVVAACVEPTSRIAAHRTCNPSCRGGAVRGRAKPPGMRDLVASEALAAMAGDAAKRFRELVAAGHEIPYDLEEPGNGSPLPRYVPLTGRFVRDNAPALLELDSFGSACAAIESAELAGPYLEELGIDVPPDARTRAELAGTVFLCRLWMDSTDFSLEGDRLSEAIAELEAGGQTRHDEIEVVVPLRGLRMPVVRLELGTATIVRADTVEVPAEARAAEGAGAAGWEPTFLAAARISSGETAHEDGQSPDAGARSVEAFRQLITALRLFQAGGVGLGPYAWTRAGADRWRRIATGAGRPRRGGYRLAEDALGELTTLSRVLAHRSTSVGPSGRDGSATAGAVARAVSRFEAGLERNVVLEALNDYLLALRFVLEGGGPADLGLAMRVAALCAEPEQRSEIKAIVDRGLALERELWSGEPAPAAEGVPTAAATVAAIEELTRAILRDAACGHLGADLRATADEILLADGLAVGEGEAEQRGGSEEWDLPPDEPEEGAEQEVEDDPSEQHG